MQQVGHSCPAAWSSTHLLGVVHRQRGGCSPDVGAAQVSQLQAVAVQLAQHVQQLVLGGGRFQEHLQGMRRGQIVGVALSMQGHTCGSDSSDDRTGGPAQQTGGKATASNPLAGLPAYPPCSAAAAPPV